MLGRRELLGRVVPAVVGGVAGLGGLAGCGSGAGRPDSGGTPSSAGTPGSSGAPESTGTPSGTGSPRPADRRYRYGKHPNQWADLYLPESGTRHPVVVTIHGGGWTVGNDAREDVPFALDLVRDGIAVWNIEYRLLEAGGGWPMTLADVAAAIDLLPVADRAPAPTDRRTPAIPPGRLDLGNVVVFGASAGGHLAAWACSRKRVPARQLATLGGPPKQPLRGAVAYAAPLDLVYDSNEYYGASTHLLDGTPQKRPDRYAAASPYALLPTGVPVVCLHGDADQVIPLEQSTRYVDRARQLGDPAKLIKLPGVDHPNNNPVRVGEDLWSRTKTEITALLGR